MKKIVTVMILLLAMFGLSQIANATVWRVNSAPGANAPYTTAQAAHDAATAGDTIYLEPSSISYGGLTLYKQLVIIGTGYFLGQNPQTQALTVPSTLDAVSFNTGSDGSKMMGVTCTGYVYLYTSDILITRCYLLGYYGIYGYANLGNIIISQNYIPGGYYSMYFAYPANNILISNNYLGAYIASSSNFTGIVANNVIAGYLQMYNVTIKNNIFVYPGNFTNYNCIWTNNLDWSSSVGNDNGNISNVDMATVFLGATGNSTDGQWQLKAGSPAIGAGENGVDCGMYGGLTPYVLSGMPNIPAIYYFTAPSMPTNIINVNMKVKSHN